MLRTIFTLLFIVALTVNASDAMPKPRPYTGSAALVVRPSFTQVTANASIVLYQEPGVGRIGEFSLSQLPRLATAAADPDDIQLLAVMGKKGTWLKIAYDDAGREGWLEPGRNWEYQPWEQFLRGHFVRLLPGLRKEHYIVRNEPLDTAPPLNPPSRQQDLRVIEVRGDWAMVMSGEASYGWLRWRDDDCRFLISIDISFTPQKH